MLTTKIYNEGNKVELVKLLKKCLGKGNVIEPHKSGNISVKDYTINYKSFYDYFKHDQTNIKEYKWSNNGDTITLKEALEFMIEINHRAATTGLYHIYSRFVDTFFSEHVSQQIDGDYYNVPVYSDIKDKTIKNIVTPTRDEFKYLRWILDNVYGHTFFKMFINDLDITYQKSIKPSDNKKYDMLFQNIDLVIELQEEKVQHTDNPNDETKRAMVLLRGKRMVYFRMDICSNGPGKYMEKLWKNEIEPAIFQGLVYKFHKNENQLITKLMTYEMNKQNSKELEILEDEIKPYQKEVIKKEVDENGNNVKKIYFVQKDGLSDDEIITYNTFKLQIKDLKDIINPKNNNVNILFEWYKNSHGKTNKYLINPFENYFQQIFDNFDFRNNKQFNYLLKLCVDAKYCGYEGEDNLSFVNTINFSDLKDLEIKKLRLSWKGLEKIFLNPQQPINKEIIGILNESGDIDLESRYMLNLIQVVRDTYVEKICDYMYKHSEAINCSDKKLQDNIEEHIKKTIINKNKKEIEDANRSNKILQTEYDDLKEKTKSLLSLNDSVVKQGKKYYTSYSKLRRKSKLDCPEPTELNTTIADIEKVIDEIKVIFDKKKNKTPGKKTFTYNNKVGESIIEEIPKFGIVFTGDCKNNVEYEVFEGLCNVEKVPKRTISSIIMTLNNSSNPKPQFVERVKLTKELGNKKIVKKYISDDIDELDNYSNKSDKSDNSSESESDSESYSNSESESESDNDSCNVSKNKFSKGDNTDNSDSDSDSESNSDNESDSRNKSNKITTKSKVVTNKKNIYKDIFG